MSKSWVKVLEFVAQKMVFIRRCLTSRQYSE